MWVLLGVFWGCAAPAGPGELLSAPGEAGPYGAAWVSAEVPARVSEALPVEVTFPADADGWPDTEALPGPAVVLVQGGLVEVARYRWLAGTLAAQGYVVVAPNHPGDLAFFAAENGAAALAGVEAGRGVLDGLLDPGAPAVVGGHSLGGVVAAILWADDAERFAGLFTLASYPADSTDVESRTDGAPYLALTGALDALAGLEQVEAGWARFPGPRWLGVVDGMGHYGWTDDDSPEDLEKGGDLKDGARTDAEARADALPPLLLFLEASLSDSPEAAQAALDEGDFSGVTWSP